MPKNPHEKAMQRALIQYRDPKNRELVREALEKSGRTDLIGYGPRCLIPPPAGEKRDSGHRTERSEKNRRTGGTAFEKSVKKKKTIRNIHKKKQ